ncbi:MAG: ABC transporter ATP-binding protein/permease [Pseudoflavonifractor capillosus]|uniref:ABC transporter ATP-binding protein n=1 Tax=Pseudoflavonifractor capillosus TaxID=106588 RepID=UPI0023FA2079|nr:ABC transporter ATP-binding protein [Pseudoflavonifractor capillosus]MCI5928310.1 ABC transporter ATP-binding protein/permease [Pseudoflavonifractor capillosus]MDY4660250.1 ABC transporter ATP-binding protein [Pseudoflavonifractor capillosus]
MLLRIFSYLKPYRKYTILAVLCIAIEAVFELIIPFLMADIVDVGVKNGDTTYIFTRGAMMGVCALLALLFGAGSARFAAICGQGLGAELRKEEYRKIQAFSFANTDRFQTASLVTRLTSDVTAVQNAVATGLRPGVRSPIMMVMALGLSFRMSPRLAVVFLVAAPLLGILLWQIVKRVRPMYGKMQGAMDQVNRIIQENLTAIRVVKACVRGDYEVEKFEEVNKNLRDTTERAFRLAALNMPAMQLIMYATILAILWFGGRLTMVGGMEVGDLTGFLSYVLQVLNSLMMFSAVFLMLTRSLASCRRILEVMDEEIDITEIPGVTDPDAKVERGEIVFDDVTFRYRAGEGENVLDHVSFRIEAGQTVGILGQTGSAKSTLVQLIPRLYDVTDGAVYVDGRNVKEYPLKHLRDAIAMVLQKNTLFSGTVKDNLRWGNDHATDEEIDAACRIACVDEFIDRLQNGYDTELGQGGVNVSGGQKQRLCIARAILKNPKVLILDDSTSAVDTATEAKIRQGLADGLPGTTKIIIAQRVTSVQDADQILILEDGKISAVGTHESLMASNPFYQGLYQSQQKGALE